jgi:hypothetical protein
MRNCNSEQGAPATRLIGRAYRGAWAKGELATRLFSASEKRRGRMAYVLFGAPIIGFGTGYL